MKITATTHDQQWLDSPYTEESTVHVSVWKKPF